MTSIGNPPSISLVLLWHRVVHFEAMLETDFLVSFSVNDHDGTSHMFDASHVVVNIKASQKTARKGRWMS